MIIAIDGPAGVGKSTIAKMIAQKLNVYYLNSGNFYRAVTLHILNCSELNPENLQDQIKGAKDSKIDVVEGRFFLDGEDVEDKLHTPKIDLWASKVSVNPKVREIVNNEIHALTDRLSIVCEGRDMTTVVFPNAEHKFFFDAQPEIRAKRRFDQNPQAMPYDQVLSEIIWRDNNDRNKPVGGLKLAQDATYVDTSYLTINQVCEKVIDIIMSAGHR